MKTRGVAGAGKPLFARGVQPVTLGDWLQAALHDFAAARGSADFGSELDLLVAAPLTSTLTLETRLAVVQGTGAGMADRTKIWASLDWKL